MSVPKSSIKRIAIGLAALLLFILFPFNGLTKYAKQVLYGTPSMQNSPSGVNASIILKKGDYLLFGHYLEEPILWQVISIENGKPLLFSNAVLCFKAFSASENPLKSSSDWRSSTLRQWLNSAQENIRWKGAPPEPKNIYEGHNAYVDEPGFLSNKNFSDYEIALIEKNEDSVFLLTKKQLKILPAAERRKSPTKAALKQDDSPYISLRPYSWYWTADPIGTNSQSVCSVTGKGGFYKSLATDGVNGVCPALHLKSDAILSSGGNGDKSAPYQIIW